ncbi:uncharacterized protein CBL_02981 [Carabus blaptoides fortunei]
MDAGHQFGEDIAGVPLFCEKMSWSKEQVIELINLYREKDVLYVVRNPEYRNKHARNQAMAEIEAHMKTIRPSTTTYEIKLKINALRSNFLNEHRKWQMSLKSGASLDDMQQPSLWYYSDMTFLLDHVVPRRATDSLISACDANDSQSGEMKNELIQEDNVDTVDELWSPTETVYMPGVIGNEDPLAGPSRHSSTDSGISPRQGRKRKLLEEDLFHNTVKAIKEITTTMQTKQNKFFVPTVKQNEDIFVKPGI